jgi:serine O-acetyltransferase
MIRSKADLRAYLDADRIALHRSRNLAGWLSDDIWRYERRLRKLEYHLNLGHRVLAMWVQFVLIRTGNRLGFSIPPNVFGPGLSLAHAGTVAVNQHARVGQRCRVSVNVVIGAALRESSAAPSIGDDCFLGPGAVVLGAVVLGDNVVVGANAVVTRSFPGGNVTLVGAPAHPIQAAPTNGSVQAGPDGANSAHHAEGSTAAEVTG